MHFLQPSLLGKACSCRSVAHSSDHGGWMVSSLLVVGRRHHHRWRNRAHPGCRWKEAQDQGNLECRLQHIPSARWRCISAHLMLNLYHRYLPKWICSPHLQAPSKQWSRILCNWRTGTHSLEDSGRPRASHQVPHMYGGSSIFRRTCQLWRANHQEYLGKPAPHPRIRRQWLDILLWPLRTGCCEGPSSRTSSRHMCSQRQDDARSAPASSQAQAVPCRRCTAWWSLDPLWLAAHRTLLGAYAWSWWRMQGPRNGARP